MNYFRWHGILLGDTGIMSFALWQSCVANPKLPMVDSTASYNPNLTTIRERQMHGFPAHLEDIQVRRTSRENCSLNSLWLRLTD